MISDLIPQIATSSEVIKDKQSSITKLSGDIIQSKKCHKNLREKNVIAEQIACNNENTASLESNKNVKDVRKTLIFLHYVKTQAFL